MWLDTFNQMRKSSGMSLDELCEKSGIPKGTLAKITSGITKAPSLETMRSLVYAMGYTLKDLDDGLEASDNFSKEEKEHIKKYRSLDRYGKEAVDDILDVEWRRCEDENRFLEETAPPDTKPEPKVIPLYWTPAAAGYASPAMGDDYDSYELKPEDPQGAVFAIKISGDSMEPYFPDGSIAFCNRDPVSDGDVGVFFLDGDTFIKQYHHDRMMGITYLFSLNRDRADADKLITRTSGQTLACFGRVMSPRRYPLPV